MYQPRSPGASPFEVLREAIRIESVIPGMNGHRKISCISPSHADRTPSMHVYEDHVHCFACGFHGDVVDVWGVQKGLIRPIEAALDLAREYNVTLPEMSPEARQKAQEQREREASYTETAQAGHRALGKNDAVREWWEGRGFGDDLRARYLLGSNKLGTEALIPFWHRGKVQGLIRRKLVGEPKYRLPNAEEFPEGYKPLFIPNAPGSVTFLVEGYVDALAVAASGRSVVAVGGTDISDAQKRELAKVLPEGGRIYILPDDDESGEEAARTWVRKFFPRAAICPLAYGEGGKDIADAFARDGVEKTAEHLDRATRGAQDLIDIETEAAAELKDRPRECLTYAVENIVPLIVRVGGEAQQDAIADILVGKAKLKKSWLNKAIKAERSRLLDEAMTALVEEAQEKAERLRAERQGRVDEAQDEIDELTARPGVLERLRNAAATMHNVRRDEKALELALLVALGAQLEPLPNGRPLGASMLVTAQAGRGKNHIVDAAVTPLPEEFYFSFEIASGQSLYYKADEDPGFLQHTFAYPNEIEGAEQLWEFLRPMLSKGSAKKIVTAKDSDGNMTTREIVVEGPVTIAIPTIRNKTDEQLQTRLLVAELPDYPGRVKEHSAALSAQLLPDAAVADHSHLHFLWQEGLRQLTEVRRVVFPLDHPDFAFDDDGISHGARLWANLLSIMATHAWLEQRNRRLLELGEERVAVEATPDDYEAAYGIFNEVCKRTVVNLSGTHRSILNGVYKLQEDNPDRDGFRQREIATAGEVSLGAVSNHKTFLVTSAKLLRESEDGLALVEGADPSWWETGKMMEGLPTPAQVRSWWEDRDPDPPEGGERREPVNTEGEGVDKPDTYEGSGVHAPDEHDVNTFREGSNGSSPTDGAREHVQDPFTEGVNAQNGASKGDTNGKGGGVHAFTPSRGEPDPDDVKKVIAEIGRSGSGPAKALANYLDKPNSERLKYLASAVLVARGEDSSGWQRIASAVKDAASDPANHPLDCECEVCP
ncbi:MAG: toprim domain-containing protein [Actinomycetota bacterium]|nr:toprim domain-containing protein [Actinomycetota bacterium]